MVFGGLIWKMINDGFPPMTYVLIALIVITCALILFYAPVFISVDDDALRVRRYIKSKRIPLSEIASVTLMAPTMAETRIVGAGGWFGYWGWMKEPLLGKYFAYYGKASDCFLVRLKNGRQYLLGCTDPASVVAYLQSRLKK